MKDLTNRNNNELLNCVFDDEYFTCEIHDRAFLLALVKEEFIYTDIQLERLTKYMERPLCQDALSEYKNGA